MWLKVWNLKKVSILKFYRGLISGILTGFAFSIPELWYFVFLSLVPLCVGLLKESQRYGSLLWGYAMGYYTIALYWLSPLITENIWGRDDIVARLVGLLAVFGTTLVMGILTWISFFPYQYIRNGNSYDIFLIAGFYMLSEWMQEYMLGLAFPWAHLGIVVLPFHFFIQSADIIGGLGISGLVVICNACFAALWIKMRGMDDRKDSAIFVSCILLVLNIGYGVTVYAQKEKLYDVKETLIQDQITDHAVLLVQGNHPSGIKWFFLEDNIVSDYLTLSKQNMNEDVSLVIWPETALPFVLQRRPETIQMLKEFCKEYHTQILTGAFDHQEENTYNAMFLITEDGISEGIYHKQYLVPFGEYIPYNNFLSFITPSQFVQNIGNLSLQKGIKVQNISSEIGELGGLICYESIFPDAARQAVKMGAEYLIIISNDSWLDYTQGLREHHAHAVLRAIEQRRYTVHSSNTGITSFISPYGTVISQAKENIQTTLSASIFPKDEKTIYFYMGNKMIIPIWVVWILGIVIAIRRYFQKNNRIVLFKKKLSYFSKIRYNNLQR